MKGRGSSHPTAFRGDGSKVPKNSLHFVMQRSDLSTFSEKDGENGEKEFNFEMVGYTGDTIPNHWYWGNLALDFAGMSLKDSTPILYRHDDDRPMGFSDSPKVVPDKGLVFTDKDTTFLQDNEDADKFIKNSLQGMPYQASVGMKPFKIEFVDDDEVVEVNGHELKGPGTVIREWELRETSICLFGYDSGTSAGVFSEEFADDGEEVSLTGVEILNQGVNEPSEEFMDIKTFKEKHPDTATLFAQSISEPLQTQITNFEATVSGLESDLEKANDKLEAKVSEFNEMKTELTELKNESAKASAEKIFSDACDEHGVPEVYVNKIRKQLDFSAHIEDGKVDENAVKEAIATEFADWEDVLTFKKPDSVQGGGSTPAAKKDETTMSADDINDVHKQLGHKTN